MGSDYNLDWDECVEDVLEPGDVVFLQRVTPRGHRPYYALSHDPTRTNQSFKPVLYGWCGSTDGTSVEALGLVEVTKTTRYANVSPTHFRRLDSTETSKALAEKGWEEVDRILYRVG